jgi:serine/threonine protein kinase
VIGSGRFEISGSESVPYMVMELLAGATLAEVARKYAKLDPVDVVSIVADVAAGVSAAHQQGIVHRDLKPANVFLHVPIDDERLVVPKVLDFGISKFVDPELDGGLTTTGAVLGSTMYMSPEQAMGSRNVDLRSDVWSLGVLLYRLITGESPLPANQPEVLVALASPVELPLPGLATARVPPPIATIIRSCLRKKREARYPSAVELEAALRQALATQTRRPAITDLLGPAPSGRTLVTAPADLPTAAVGKLEGPVEPVDANDRAEDVAEVTETVPVLQPSPSAPALPSVPVGVATRSKLPIGLLAGGAVLASLGVLATVLAFRRAPVELPPAEPSPLPGLAETAPATPPTAAPSIATAAPIELESTSPEPAVSSKGTTKPKPAVVLRPTASPPVTAATPIATSAPSASAWRKPGF